MEALLQTIPPGARTFCPRFQSIKSLWTLYWAGSLTTGGGCRPCDSGAEGTGHRRERWRESCSGAARRRSGRAATRPQWRACPSLPELYSARWSGSIDHVEPAGLDGCEHGGDDGRPCGQPQRHGRGLIGSTCLGQHRAQSVNMAPDSRPAQAGCNRQMSGKLRRKRDDSPQPGLSTTSAGDRLV